MPSNLTQVQFIAKRVYSSDRVTEHTLRDHVMFNMVTRKTVFGGEDFRYTVKTGNPQSVSGTFTTAQTQAAAATATGSSKGAQFACQPALKYGVVQIDGPSLTRLKGNYQSFFDLVTMEFDSTLEELGDSLAFDLTHDGSGNRGQRASIATNTITLTVPDDARNFKEGMVIIASANADGSTPRVGSSILTAVDEDAGTITMTLAADITAFANNDFLFRQGDPATGYDGIARHLPLTAPVFLSDSFRGVDRGRNPRRLAGVRVNDPNSPVEETAGLIGVKIKQSGKSVAGGCAFWNPIRFWECVRRLNAKVEYQKAGGTADYGFEYIMIHTPAGTVKAYSDADIPINRQYVGKIDSVEIRHLEEFPGPVRDDGKLTDRVSNADAIEARYRAHSQTIFRVPGEWGVASLPST